MAQIWSGVFEGRTTGTPISLLVQNQDQRSRDYETYEHIQAGTQIIHLMKVWFPVITEEGTLFRKRNYCQSCSKLQLLLRF